MLSVQIVGRPVGSLALIYKRKMIVFSANISADVPPLAVAVGARQSKIGICKCEPPVTGMRWLLRDTPFWPEMVDVQV
jgi:hypothetical protein